MKGLGCVSRCLIFAPIALHSESPARTWMTDNFIANGNGCLLGQGAQATTQNDTLDIVLLDMKVNLPAFAGLPFAVRRFCNFSMAIESVANHFPKKFAQSLTFRALKSENASAVVVAQTTVGDVSLPSLEAQLPAGILVDEERKRVELDIDLAPHIVDPIAWCADGTMRSESFTSRIIIQGMRSSDTETLMIGESLSEQGVRFSALVEWLPCPEPYASSTHEREQHQPTPSLQTQ